MSRHLRLRLPGTAIFFTVTLAGRGGSLLVDHVGLLKASVAQTRAERPFGIAACVVLPDHLHCIWTLPEGDTDYSTRWRLIKARFSRGLWVGARRESHVRRHELGIWQRRFWEHHIRDEEDMAAHLH
ncbi:transposase [Paracoccus sp. S1E-3]|uniref:REP-associated tyrosine transposase n=1 Tax=Paracoccus sp. S1E-3 TaxID=2756130 RepID=UPI0021057B6E|nr:transposase [Paracoccus sp. S1E-3]